MKTTKRVLSLILCAVMLAGVCTAFSGCSEKLTKDNPGVVIPIAMQSVTSFDPAVAYADEASAKMLSLVYQGLFRLSENGSVKKALCKSYSFNKSTRVLTIKLNSTMWSDGTYVDASDFSYAWTRILDPEFHCDAASLLFGVKNAIKVKNGDESSSNLGVVAAEKNKLEITLEDWVDVDSFLYNLTSVALYPVRDDVVEKLPIFDRGEKIGEDENWAILPAVLVSNGAFYIKKVDLYSETPMIVLERNAYYYLDPEKSESLDKYVVPYRLNIYITNGIDEQVEFVQNIFNSKKLENPQITSDRVKEMRASMTEEELKKYTNSQISEMAEAQIKEEIKIEYSLDYIEKMLTKTNASVKAISDLRTSGDVLYNEVYSTDEIKANTLSSADEMMTGALLFNTSIEALSSKEVRNALSSVLDREYIASDIVGNAKAANGLISYKVFNTDKKTSFREVGGKVISTKQGDVAKAKAAITSAGLEGKEITLTVKINAKSLALGKYIKEQWEALGLRVILRVLGYTKYDYTRPALKMNKDTGSKEWTDEILYDGLTRDYFRNAYIGGDYEVILADVNMLSPDAFTVLSTYSPKYSGSAYDFSVSAEDAALVPHNTGYSNSEYDKLIESALTETDKTKRADILHNAEKLLLEDMPVAPLFFYTTEYSVSELLKGFDMGFGGVASFIDTNYPTYVQVEVTEAPTTQKNPVTEAPAN